MNYNTKTDIVICDYCKQSFQKPLSRIKESLKLNQKQYCSLQCKHNAKITSVKTFCMNCNQPIKIKQNVFNKSKTKHFFCSQSCAAVYNNTHKTKKSKPKIIKIIKEKLYINCRYCGKKFHPKKKDQKYCNKNCAFAYKNGEMPLTKDQISQIIHSFVKEHGTIPTCRSNYKWQGAADIYFGGWNKMILELGYKHISQNYCKKILKCKDGHIADSTSELIIDNWLFINNIEHQCHVYYPNSKMTCDFYLPKQNIWLEYFGLAGEDEQYDKRMQEKREFCKKCGLKLIEILPNQLYPKININIF